MVEAILITTILLAVFLCLRRMLDGKIPAKLQYGAWLLIALRLLLVWVPLPESSVSVMNLLPVVQDSFQSLSQSVLGEKMEKPGGDGEQNPAMQADSTLSQEDALAKDIATSQDQQIVANMQSHQEKQLESASAKRESSSVTETMLALLCQIYGIGILLALLWILAKNIWFWRGLCRSRVLYEGQLPVVSLPGNLYLVDYLKSPFLFGKHIYISPEMLSDPQKLQHILVHETCHWKQGDSFWSVLRCLCLAVYWYHPLVWYGARLSVVDAELACDERAIRMMGEESRHSYGETLLGLIRKQAAFLECSCVSTQMSGNKRETKKRLERIVEQGKRNKGRILFLLVSMSVLCLLTLPGKEQEKNAVAEEEWKRVEQEGFPCIVVDEQSNVIGTRRGELLTRVILEVHECYGQANPQNPQIQAGAFSACPNLKTLILPYQSNTDADSCINYIDPDAFRGCPEDLVVYCNKESYAWTRLQELGITVKEIPEGDSDWQLLGKNTDTLKKLQGKLDGAKYIGGLTEPEMRQLYGEPFFIMTESGEVWAIGASLSEYVFHSQKLYLPTDANVLGEIFCNDAMLGQSVTIPKNIEEIGGDSFRASMISEIHFEEGSHLRRIGYFAFEQASFTEIQLLEGLWEIRQGAFYSCRNLTEITIPESVKSIGSRCFRLCSSLERVVILNPDISLEEDAFDDEIVNPELSDDEIDMENLDSNFIPNNRLTIVCHPGSNAEKYAREYGLQVEYLK